MNAARTLWLVALAAGVAGCGLGETERPVRGGTLHLAQRQAPSLHPLEPEDLWNIPYRCLVYEGLVRFDTSATGVVPGHAERWEVSEDGCTYSFHLAAGRRYADGTPIRAADYARGLEACFAGRPRSPGRARFWALAGAGAGDGRRGSTPLGVEAPDERTVILRLRAPDERLLEKLALPSYAVPFPEGVAPGEPPPASGPYRFELAERRLVFARNPHYGGTRPAWCDTIAVRLGTSARGAVQLAAGGQADLVWPEPASARGRLQREAGLRRLPNPRGTEICYFLVLNGSVPPTNRLPVRRGVASAVDRLDLGPPWAPMQDITNGAGARVEFPGFDAEIVRGELALGLKPRGVTLSLTVARDSHEEDLATALLPGLGRAGVHAELRRREPAEKRAALAQAGGFVTAIWGGRCAPGRGPAWDELFLDRGLGGAFGGNLAHFREASGQLDALLLAAGPSAPAEARQAVLRHLVDRVPLVPLARLEETIWANPRVRNLRVHAVCGPLFAEAWIAPAGGGEP